jgi:hypothetical protein
MKSYKIGSIYFDSKSTLIYVILFLKKDVSNAQIFKIKDDIIEFRAKWPMFESDIFLC